VDTLPTDLHNRDDAYAWATTQAAKLRAALAAGDLPADIDWDEIIEELDALGRSEVLAVNSHLEVALEHLLKLACWPNHDASRQWTVSARSALRQVQKRWRSSMKGHIDIDAIHADSIETLAIIGPDYGPSLHQPAPSCRLSLPDLLAAPTDAAGIAALAVRLRAA